MDCHASSTVTTLPFAISVEDISTLCDHLDQENDLLGWSFFFSLLKQVVVVAGPVFLLLALLFALGGAYIVLPCILLGSFVLTGCAFWLAQSMPFIQRRQRRRHCERYVVSESKKYPLQATIDSVGVTCTGQHSKTTHIWAAFSSVVATESHIVFWMGRAFSFIIPRRAFSSPKDCNAFMHLATQNIAAAKNRSETTREATDWLVSKRRGIVSSELPIVKHPPCTAKTQPGIDLGSVSIERESNAFWPEGLLPIGAEVTIVYKNTVDDFAGPLPSAGEPTVLPWYIGNAILAGFCVLVLSAFGLVVLWISENGSEWFRNRVMVGLAVGFVLWKVWKWYFRREARKWAAERFRFGNESEALGPVLLRIGPQGITTERATSETYTSWMLIDKVASTTRHAFLLEGSVILYIIPRRAFPSEADFQKFIDLMRHYTEAAKEATQNINVTK